MMIPPMGSFAEGFVSTYLAADEHQRRQERSKLEFALLQKEMKLKEKRQEFEEQKLLEELKSKRLKDQAQQSLAQLFAQPQAQTDPLHQTLGGMQFATAPAEAATGNAPYTAPAHPVLQQALAPRPQPTGLAAMPEDIRQLMPALLRGGYGDMASKFLEPYLPQRPKAKEPYTLAEGATRYDEHDRLVATGAPKAAKAPATPYAALVAAGMDPFDAFEKLEESRNRLRAKYRKDAAGITMTTPDGTVVSIGGPTGTGATKPLPPGEQQKFVAGAESLRLGLETLDDLTTLVLQDPGSFGAAADWNKTVATALAEGQRGFRALAGMNNSTIAGVQTQGTKAAELVARIATANTSRGEYLFDTLVFQQARINNPVGVLTDPDVEQAKRQVGGGALKSAEDYLPKAQEMKKQFRRKYESLQRQAASFPGLRLTPLPAEAATPASGSARPVSEMSTEELFRELGKTR
jgi:hypothetical protein